ncbi:hypothetical protein [Streptomyces albidoflavus]|uniref:hypothetical protein n=1 Tax=Streptomyces albidoflavus TaxID=1886 RepID=UPI00344F37BB
MKPRGAPANDDAELVYDTSLDEALEGVVKKGADGGSPAYAVRPSEPASRPRPGDPEINRALRKVIRQQPASHPHTGLLV